MNRYRHVAWMALLAGATACSSRPPDRRDDRRDVASAGPEANPRAAAVPALSAPRPGAAGPATPAHEANGAGGFVDACLLPGTTRATFAPVGDTGAGASDAAVAAVLDLPFPFTVYGAARAQAWITVDGQLGFGATPGDCAFGQSSCVRSGRPILLVNSTNPGRRLGPAASVCYATTGAAPHRKLVVTWEDAPFYDAWLTSNVTFSATLHESTNVVDVVLERAGAPYQPFFEVGGAAALGLPVGGLAHAFSWFPALAPGSAVMHYNP